MKILLATFVFLLRRWELQALPCPSCTTSGTANPQLTHLYLIWRRDAFIHAYSRTPEGQEYLDNAWRMEQTEPDRAALRKKLRKEGAQNGEQ